MWVLCRDARIGYVDAAANYEIALTAAEIAYYDTMQGLGENAGEYGCLSAELLNEYGNVGAGLGGGFDNTHELHVMKYKEAMKTPDKPHWIKGVNEEHERFKKHKVFKAVPRSQVPPRHKILTSTWAMKKKANGTYIELDWTLEDTNRFPESITTRIRLRLR